jgi:hypothetical protein
VRLGVCLAALGRTAEARQLLSAGYERLRSEPFFKRDAQEASHLLATMAAGPAQH